MFRPLIIVLLLMQGALVAGAEDAIIRNERLDMPPTLIGDTRTQELEIPVRPLPPGEYIVLKDISSPFVFNIPESDLRTVNGVIVLSVSFKPTVEGAFSDVIELVREPAVVPNDTIRVRVSGTAFRIERRVVLNFGRVFRGDTARRAVPIAAELADNETWSDTKTLDRPFIHRTPGKPIGEGDTLFFVFEFAPRRLGTFRDSVGLVRIGSGVPLDTIQVILQGEGIRGSFSTEVDWGPTLVGDSILKRRAFRPPPGGQRRYRVNYAPEAPFELQVDGDLEPTPPDSLIASVSYAPRDRVPHRDSLILERIDGEDRPVDTVRIFLNGDGRGLQARDSVIFTDGIVGKAMTKEHEISLPLEPLNATFSYVLEPSEIGPFTTELLEPIDASKSKTITIKVTALGDEFKEYEEVATLYRFDEDEILLDSTNIRLALNMKPQPVSISLAWAQDTMLHEVGDTAVLELQLMIQGELDEPLKISEVSAKVPYNATVMVPIVADGQQRIVEQGTTVWQVQESFDPFLEISTGTATLATIRAVVVLGDASIVTLPIENTITFAGEDPQQIKSIDGLLIVSDVWEHQNGIRLVNPFTGDLVLTVAPNPVVSSSIISVDNVPDGEGTLVVYASTGELVLDLTDELQAGQREWIVSSGSGSSTSLPPGSYYARLVVASADAGDIQSVVRQFIVQ